MGQEMARARAAGVTSGFGTYRALPPPKPVTFPAESFGEARALTDYEYKVNQPELQRLRENNPTAADTIMTEVEAAPLTWEAYDKLTPDQRAAVDFNSLLVEAREKDLQPWEPMSSEEFTQYGKDVREMFGEKGGSRRVAPATVALLKRIDFKAVGQDLDEFLSLERAISVDELGDFSFSKDEVAQLTAFDSENPGSTVETGITKTGAYLPPAVRESLKSVPQKPGDNYASVRTEQNLAAIDTALIKGALDAYKARLAAFEGAPWSITANLGVQQEFKPAEMPAGYVRTDNPMDYRGQLSIAYEDAYNLLRGNPNEQGLAALYADFDERQWTEEDKAGLWTYLNDRTRNELDYMGDKDAQMVRDILGWE